jgi:ABC-type antimicrobial peptide transport system permease subunit
MNLKQSFRIIFRNKTYSILNISGLAAGIAAVTLILLWVEYQVNYDSNVPNLKNVYVTTQNQRYGNNIMTFFVSPGAFTEVLDAEFPEVKRTLRYLDKHLLFTSGNAENYINESGAYSDSTIFPIAGFHFIKGQEQTVFEPAFPIVISEKMFKKIFNDEDPIGKVLKSSDGYEYTVTGVFKNSPKNTSFNVDWVIPFRIYEDDMVRKGNVTRGSWESNWLYSYVELQPNSDIEALNQKIKRLKAEKTGNEYAAEMFLYPLGKQQLYGQFKDGVETGGGYISTVRMFFWIGMAILFIACINFMNLSTARSEKRAMEVGARKTFGAKRSGLVRMFMAESACITFIALILAVGIVLLCLPSFNNLISYPLKLSFTNPYHVFGLLSVGVLCALLAGAYPAFYLSSFSPLQTLKKLKNIGVGSVIWIRKGLVVFQFVVAFVLICATMTIYEQIRYAHSRPLGMELEHVAYYSPTGDIIRNFSAVRQALISTGYVEEASLSTQLMIRLYWNGGGYDWQGRLPDVNPLVSHVEASDKLFATTGVKIIEGRDFTAQEVEEGRNVVIINRSFADIMGEEGRVGSFIKHDRTFEIVGITENFVYNNAYRENPGPALFYASAPNSNFLLIRMKPEYSKKKATETINTVLKSFTPNENFQASYLEDTFNSIFWSERFAAKLAGLFAALAVFLSCLGLFGLSAFSAEQRTKEIGIRKVLGASVMSLTQLLIKSFFVLIALSFVIAIPIAYDITGEWLDGYEYRIHDTWWLLVATAGLIIVITLLTVGIQTFKAATANPVDAIKTE